MPKLSWKLSTSRIINIASSTAELKSQSRLKIKDIDLLIPLESSKKTRDHALYGIKGLYKTSTLSMRSLLRMIINILYW